MVDDQIDMELTSRELATLILFAAFVGLAFVLSSDRWSLIRSFQGVLRAFGAWKVWVPVAAYLVYSTGVVALAGWVGIWRPEQMKDTAIVVLFTGLPILFNATKFKEGRTVFSRVIKEIVGVSAILAVYLNLAPLPLWAELILQSVLAVLLMGAAVGKREPKTAGVARAFDALLALIGLCLLVHATVEVVSGFADIDWSHEALAFAVSVWLPIAQVPFIYAFGFIAASESALTRLRLQNNHELPPFRVRLALVLGFRGSLRYASRFSMQWIPRMAKERSFKEATRTMRDFREAVRARARQKRERLDRLEKRAGIHGVGEDGLWWDRREFSETKKALDDLYFAQMGVRRNRGGHYLDDPNLLLTSLSLRGLPAEHGIDIRTSGDGRAWSGWRRTVGGYFLGTGGREEIEERWQYSGTAPPSDFPSAQDPGWREITQGNRSPEWATNDDEGGDV